MRLRALDSRMLMAQRQGKTSFYMQHLGEEAISCGVRKALAQGDMNFPTYRQAGLLIASDYPMAEMLNQLYSNRDDPLHGRQLPSLNRPFLSSLPLPPLSSSCAAPTLIQILRLGLHIMELTDHRAISAHTW